MSALNIFRIQIFFLENLKHGSNGHAKFRSGHISLPIEATFGFLKEASNKRQTSENMYFKPKSICCYVIDLIQWKK